MARLVGAADGAEVTPCAGPFGGRGGKEPELDRPVDDLERLEPGAPVPLGEGHRVLSEAARRGRVEQAPLAHRPAKDLLDRQPVDHRLERRAAADDRPCRRAVAAGLVIGDAKLRRPGSRLDDVDRTAKDESIVDADRFALAALVAALIAQPEA